MRPVCSVLVILAVAGLQAPPAAAQAPATPVGEAGPGYYFLLGRHLEDEGRVDEAVAAHKKAIALDPQSAEVRAELAALYLRQSKAVEALEAADEALAVDPDNREANRVVGTIYAAVADQGRKLRPTDDPETYPAKGIEALEKARRDAGFDINLELMLGRLYAQTGDFAKALPLLRHVVDDQPGYQEGAVLLSAVQERAGRTDEAIATLEATLRANPTYFGGQLRLAELYERNSRWAEAAEAFGRAQALNSRASGLTPRRAVALINAGEAGEARELIEQTIAGASGEPDPAMLYLLAEAQRGTDDLDGAEATARKLLSAHPDDVRGLHVLSQIQQARGNHTQAEQTLRSLIKQAPDDANALNSLGYMLAERGEKLDEAVTFLRQALTIEPGNPSYLDSLGWAYFQQGKLELADSPLTEAAGKLQDNSVVQDHLGDLRFRQRRFADATSAWERALAGDGESIDRAKIEQKIRDARARLDGK
jgi:tetratricopeptide (TPR) repeat protein